MLKTIWLYELFINCIDHIDCGSASDKKSLVIYASKDNGGRALRNSDQAGLCSRFIIFVNIAVGYVYIELPVCNGAEFSFFGKIYKVCQITLIINIHPYSSLIILITGKERFPGISLNQCR